MAIAVLTDAHRAVFPEWRAKWIAAVRSTAEVNRARTAAAISYLYSRQGLLPPQFFWMPSPMSAVLAVGFIYTIAKKFGEAHEPGPRYWSHKDRRDFNPVFCDLQTCWFEDLCRKRFDGKVPLRICDGTFDRWRLTRPQHSCRRKFCNLSAYLCYNALEPHQMNFPPWFDSADVELRRELGAHIGSPVLAQEASKPVWHSASNVRYGGPYGFWTNFWKQIWDQAQTSWFPLKNILSNDATRDEIVKAVDHVFWGASDDWDDEPWVGRVATRSWQVAEQTFCRDVIGQHFTSAELKQLEVEEELVRSCGWWWPFRSFCVVSERPNEFHVDDGGRLHHGSSAALRFSDGFGVYMWHGTQVPEDWIMHPDTVNGADVLTTKNVEERRAGFEIFGYDRVLRSAGARTIDKNENPQIGELLEVLMPYGGSLRFLRVRCGTGREFVLQVPPDVPTALAANAWTYALEPHEYQLEART
jgi:hypothetical protein